MKIAAITDDGLTISQHFGRAASYVVATVENGSILTLERRDKLGHAHFADSPHEESKPGQPHGFGPAAHARHAQMAEAIADCEALLCGGMGCGAYESMRALNIKPVVTDIISINDAVKAYIDGRMVDQTGRLH